MQQGELLFKLEEILIDFDLPQKKSLSICKKFHEVIRGGGDVDLNAKLKVPSTKIRNLEIKKMRAEGKTLAAIGKVFGLTCPAIHSILKK